VRGCLNFSCRNSLGALSDPCLKSLSVVAFSATYKPPGAALVAGRNYRKRRLWVGLWVGKIGVVPPSSVWGRHRTIVESGAQASFSELLCRKNAGSDSGLHSLLVRLALPPRPPFASAPAFHDRTPMLQSIAVRCWSDCDNGARRDLVCLQRRNLNGKGEKGASAYPAALHCTTPFHVAQQQITKNRHRLWEAMRSGIGEARRSAPHGSCCGRRSAKAQRAPSWTVERGPALLSQLAGSEPQS